MAVQGRGRLQVQSEAGGRWVQAPTRLPRRLIQAAAPSTPTSCAPCCSRACRRAPSRCPRRRWTSWRWRSSSRPTRTAAAPSPSRSSETSCSASPRSWRTWPSGTALAGAATQPLPGLEPRCEVSPEHKEDSSAWPCPAPVGPAPPSASGSLPRQLRSSARFLLGPNVCPALCRAAVVMHGFSTGFLKNQLNIKHQPCAGHFYKYIIA